MYNPKIWYDGDIVTSGGLNNIEQGIAQNASDIESLSADTTELKSGYKAYYVPKIEAWMASL